MSGRKNVGSLTVRIRVCYPLEQKHLIEEQASKIVIHKHFAVDDIVKPVLSNSQPGSVISSFGPAEGVVQNRLASHVQTPQTPNQPGAQRNQSVMTTQQTAIAPRAVQSGPSSQPNVTATKQPVQTQTQTQAPAQPSAATQVKQPVHSQSTPSTPAVVTTKQAVLAAQSGEEPDFNPVENMVSNDVLEWALGLVNKQLLTNKNDDELITRKTQIETKLQILMIQVQTGALSEEGYTEMVQKKIDEEKLLARQYMAKGNKPAAQLALTRAKIMSSELEGGDE
jgi:hypothetical protein